MKFNNLSSISPIDGRYFDKTKSLREIFSEFGLMKYRVLVEISWLNTLTDNVDIKEVTKFSASAKNKLFDIYNNFDINSAIKIKDYEKITNHDVKAIEYFLKDEIKNNKELLAVNEFIHFAATSEDINNLSHGLMLYDARDILIQNMQSVIDSITLLAKNYAGLPLLAKTHGQAASPTTLGKEMANFTQRLQRQLKQFKKVKIMGKFNGAVGNFNAHISSYPEIDWQQLTKKFVESLKLNFAKYTTQIEPHDYIAEYFDCLVRFNNILLDFSRDIWSYVSIGHFKQKIIKGEVGSSTMPHKVNPIDFENAEGNIGIANAIMSHLANKLLVSRLQRDLSDSTALRNLGVGVAHSMISYKSLLKGINKLEANKENLLNELNNNWEVLAEPIQTIMRRYGIEKPYEKLKELTRGNKIDKETLIGFINKLAIPDSAKKQLLQLEPKNYIGYANKLAKDI